MCVSAELQVLEEETSQRSFLFITKFFNNCYFFFTVLLVAVQIWISRAIVMHADLIEDHLWDQLLCGAVVQQLL